MDAKLRHHTRLVWRPTLKPSQGLALGVRNVGHGVLYPGFRHAGVKPCVGVYWCVRGTGLFRIGDRELTIKPNQIGVYFPGQQMGTACGDAPWEHRFFTVDGPLAEPIAAAFGLVPGVYDASPPPVRQFAALHRLLAAPTPENERRAAEIAYQMLSHAAAGVRPVVPRSRSDEAMAILQREWRNPDFSIKATASALGQHRSRLARDFKQSFGVSLMEYLMRLRLQEAIALLKGTAEPVASIARRCGFRDPNYFTRLLRRKLHASPQEIRRGG
jgi:AraC-like DNA-binding protein